MSGVLIYSKEEAKRNAFAVEKYEKYLSVRLVDENFRGDADFVINRTNNYKIAEFFENRGVRVFNSSALSRLANNKQLCYEFMEKNGVPIMPVNYKGTPVVKKKIDGKGGKEVYWLDTAQPFEEGYVYQKPCDTLGKDLRVWVVGGKIVTAVLRESKKDFRSNFCLGGNATSYNMNKDETELVKKITDLVPCDYVGIDFLFNNGQPVFNEIEDTVGARMVYTVSDIDIIRLYCQYIRNSMGK